MQFNNIKNITIPEGNVVKIIDSRNQIIWNKPDEFKYQRLSHIYLDGNSYFDTGLSSKYLIDTYNRFDIQLIANIQNTSGSNIYFYGSYDTSLDHHGLGLGYSISAAGTTNTLTYYKGERGQGAYVPNSNGTATEILNKDITYCMYYNHQTGGSGGFKCTARPSEMSVPATTGSANVETTMYIGTCNGRTGIKNFIGNFMRFSIFSYIQPMTIPLNESKLLIDIVPVIRLEDSVCGFYNVQAKTFLPNIGSGTATAGDLVEGVFY